MSEKKEKILLNIALVITVALTIGIIGANIKTALIPPSLYRDRQIDVEQVLKAIKDAGLVPVEAKYYEVLYEK